MNAEKWDESDLKVLIDLQHSKQLKHVDKNSAQHLLIGRIWAGCIVLLLFVSSSNIIRSIGKCGKE